MQVIIDGHIYIVDLKKVSDHLKIWWETNKQQMDKIKLDNGKTFDFSPKSISRIGFKTLMTPILIPGIHMLYAMKRVEPPKKEKHQDLLDYSTLALLGFIAELDGDKLYVESLEDHNSNSRRVSSIATYAPIPNGQLGQSREYNEDTEVSTRGEARVLSGQIGNGQDVSIESDSQEETGSTTVAERILVGHEETG